MALMMPRTNRSSWEISEVSRRAMLAAQNSIKPGAISWGLGWELESPPTGPVFHHGGNNGQIFKTFGVGEPAQQRAIVLFTNGSSGRNVYERIVRETTGMDLLEFLL
jgi:Beta-lactamase